MVGAGLTCSALSLIRPCTVRTVGGATLVVEPGLGGDPLTVNDQAVIRVQTVGDCHLLILERPLHQSVNEARYRAEEYITKQSREARDTMQVNEA